MLFIVGVVCVHDVTVCVRGSCSESVRSIESVCAPESTGIESLRPLVRVAGTPTTSSSPEPEPVTAHDHEHSTGAEIDLADSTPPAASPSESTTTLEVVGLYLTASDTSPTESPLSSRGGATEQFSDAPFVEVGVITGTNWMPAALNCSNCSRVSCHFSFFLFSDTRPHGHDGHDGCGPDADPVPAEVAVFISLTLVFVSSSTAVQVPLDAATLFASIAAVGLSVVSASPEPERVVRTSIGSGALSGGIFDLFTISITKVLVDEMSLLSYC